MEIIYFSVQKGRADATTIQSLKHWIEWAAKGLLPGASLASFESSLQDNLWGIHPGEYGSIAEGHRILLISSSWMDDPLKSMHRSAILECNAGCDNVFYVECLLRGKEGVPLLVKMVLQEANSWEEERHSETLIALKPEYYLDSD